MKSTEILGNNGDTLINNYDGDGNFQSMKRYDSQGGLADNFRYVYNSGTNRLNNVSGAADEYTYDNNGNVTKDDPNHNFEIKYTVPSESPRGGLRGINNFSVFPLVFFCKIIITRIYKIFINKMSAHKSYEIKNTIERKNVQQKFFL